MFINEQVRDEIDDMVAHYDGKWFGEASVVSENRKSIQKDLKVMMEKIAWLQFENEKLQKENQGFSHIIENKLDLPTEKLSYECVRFVGAFKNNRKQQEQIGRLSKREQDLFVGLTAEQQRCHEASLLAERRQEKIESLEMALKECEGRVESVQNINGQYLGIVEKLNRFF